MNACELCAGTGWLTSFYTIGGQPYEGLSPCRCTAGKATGDTHRRIIAANNAEMDRMGIVRGPVHPLAHNPFEKDAPEKDVLP